MEAVALPPPIVLPHIAHFDDLAEDKLVTGPAAPQKRYPCRHCTKAFSSSSNRIRHERQQHSSKPGSAAATAQLTCLFCSKVCYGQRALQLHAQQCRGSTSTLSAAHGTAPSSSALESISTSASLMPMRKRLQLDPTSHSAASASVPDDEQKAVLDAVPTDVRDGSDSDSDFRADSDSISNSDDDFTAEPTTSHRRKLPSQPPALLTDAIFDGIIAPFLQWLEQGPETVIEQTVKGRRLTTEKQLAPIRLNLRFLLTTVSVLSSPGIADPATPSLSTLVHLDSFKAVMLHLEQRGVGPARIYALSLLLKKICVYLCSRQSSTSMLYISPQTLPSWQLIDSYCNQSSRKRKMRQRDRLVLHLSQSTMSSEELTTVIRGCLAVLEDVMERTISPGSAGLLKVDGRRFTEYFITACFALLLAPRQQVFRALTTETLIPPRQAAAGNSSDNYIIRLSAEHSKVGQPVLLRVPDVLTSKVAFYLHWILPNDHQGHIFLQRGGQPRQDFSSATRAVTQHLIGRAVNAHQFRHSIATLFHGRQDSTDMMMRQLADTMNHDAETQRQFYVRQRRLDAQERLQGMLMEQVHAPS